MPVLQRSIVVVDFPVRRLTVPDNRTEVMLAVRVVVRREGIERLDGHRSVPVRLGAPVRPCYEYVSAAPTELVIQLGDSALFWGFLSRHYQPFVHLTNTLNTYSVP